MVETVTGSSSGGGVVAAAQLLHDFNVEYVEPAPPPLELAARLTDLIAQDHVTVLLGRAHGTGAAAGVAVLRIQPSAGAQHRRIADAERSRRHEQAS
jgi:hypothetical protein